MYYDKFMCDKLSPLFDRDLPNETLITNIMAYKYDVNKLYDDQVPIIEFVRYDRYDVVKALLIMGADPNSTDKYGIPPMRHATNLPMIKLLLDHDADINGSGGLHKSTVLRERISMIYSNINRLKKYPDMRTRYVEHCHKSIEIIKYLLEHGADPNIVSQSPSDLEMALETLHIHLDYDVIPYNICEEIESIIMKLIAMITQYGGKTKNAQLLLKTCARLTINIDISA